MKKYIYSVCFTFVLAAFTLFIVLDTFVISRPMEYVQEINTSMFSSNENVSRSDPAVNSEKNSNNSSSQSTDNNNSPSETSTENVVTDQSEDTGTVSEENNSQTSGRSVSTDGAELLGEYQNDQASIKLYGYKYENTAYNLDGGGSSTLYFNGEIINYPTTSGRSMKERGVSDIVYISR